MHDTRLQHHPAATRTRRITASYATLDTAQDARVALLLAGVPPESIRIAPIDEEAVLTVTPPPHQSEIVARIIEATRPTTLDAPDRDPDTA